jgi:predicted HNH restriction endonuclease
VPLCSNCHRIYHADALKLPNYPRPKYAIAELMRRLKESNA